MLTHHFVRFMVSHYNTCISRSVSCILSTSWSPTVPPAISIFISHNCQYTGTIPHSIAAAHYALPARVRPIPANTCAGPEQGLRPADGREPATKHPARISTASSKTQRWPADVPFHPHHCRPASICQSTAPAMAHEQTSMIRCMYTGSNKHSKF